MSADERKRCWAMLEWKTLTTLVMEAASLLPASPKCLAAIFLSHLNHLPMGRPRALIEIAGIYSF